MGPPALQPRTQAAVTDPHHRDAVRMIPDYPAGVRRQQPDHRVLDRHIPPPFDVLIKLSLLSRDVPETPASDDEKPVLTCRTMIVGRVREAP